VLPDNNVDYPKRGSRRFPRGHLAVCARGDIFSRSSTTISNVDLAQTELRSASVMREPHLLFEKFLQLLQRLARQIFAGENHRVEDGVDDRSGCGAMVLERVE
jgi:hypothetical protein